MQRGVASAVLSTVVPISSAAWTAATTGKGPGETGVYGFFEPVPDSYDVRLVSSLSNRAAPLWRTLTRDGFASIVFGIPVTYPPEPLLGTLVGGMLAPRDADYTWPPELADQLRQRGYEPDLEPWFEASTLDYPRIFAHLEEQREILLELLARNDWSLCWTVFKSLDALSHLSYERDLAQQVAPLYERLDAILGDLVAAVGDDTNVLLVSDHGFHEYRAGLNLHAWLLERGWAVRKEKVKRFTLEPDEPLARRERDVVRQMRGELDWSKTRAYTFVVEGNCGALRLNLAGREPEGSVAAEQAPALLEQLAADLAALTDDGGKRVVPRVWRADELYPGPHRAALPDLVFAADPELQVFADAEEAQAIGNYVQPVPDHDLWGVLVAAGPSIVQARDSRLDLPDPTGELAPFLAALAQRTFTPDAAPLPRVLDLAPTALALLGRPVPRSMQGRVLVEILRGHPAPTYVDEGEPGTPAPRETPFTPQEIEELEHNLQALGYR
jgi:predicted AlkP superfamily phosphohydrolase/phosphomutase